MIVRTRPAFPSFDARVDRVFNQLTSSLLTATPRPPIVDASWIDGNFQLTVDLPGTPEDAITVDVAGRTLNLAVNSDRLQWSRSIRLGAALDPDQVSARYLHGRLTVTVGAAATEQPRSIAIDTTAPAIEAPVTDVTESTDDTTS